MTTKGLKQTLEQRAATSARLMGHPVSAVTRARMSAAKMGHPVSEETRAKISVANLGRPGRPKSAEQRAKLSAAWTLERRAELSVATTIHGHARPGQMTSTYRSWLAMIGRCTNPSHTAYKSYGGRGIKVCGRWIHSYSNFLADMGEKPEGTEISRVDGNGDYEPGNCLWETHAENCGRRKAA